MLCTPSFKNVAFGLVSAFLLSILGMGCETAEAPGAPLVDDSSRESSPEIDRETFESFSAGNRDFAFALLDEIRVEGGDEENIFVSPHSISSALAMTYAGATGDTRQQMRQVLQFHVDDELHAAFNQLDRHIEQSAETHDLELIAVNHLWGQKDYPFREDYLELLSAHYGAVMSSVDFVDRHDQIRADINNWVADLTDDNLDGVFSEESIDEQTRLALVNTIYFDADWEETFDEDQTRRQPFELSDGSTIQVPMMRHGEPTAAGYYEGNDTVAASLPYVGEELSFVAFMPADEEADFYAWEEMVNRPHLDAVIEGLEESKGTVVLPKFEQVDEHDLAEVLRRLGLNDAFDESEADFSKMYDPAETDEPLFIDEIAHKTFIDVDEQGTEAAAATGSEGVAMAAAGDFVVAFDRPFYYVVYHHGDDAILFAGRMLDPS